MTTYRTPLVIGVLQDEIKAKNVIDALRDSGFRYDQVGVAINSSGNTTVDLHSDLVNLGVPREQARYYDNEYKQGHIVISIRPDGRDEEVRNILHLNGAYNYDTPHIDQATSGSAKPGMDGVSQRAVHQGEIEQSPSAQSSNN